MNRFSWTRRRRRIVVLLGPLAIVGALLIAAGGGAGPASSASVKLTKMQRRIMSGFLKFELARPARGSELKATARPAHRGGCRIKGLSSGVVDGMPGWRRTSSRVVVSRGSCYRRM